VCGEVDDFPTHVFCCVKCGKSRMNRWIYRIVVVISRMKR